MAWVAYVDESMRIRRDGGPAVYVLAAAMLEDTDVEDVRERVGHLATTSGQRFHWRNESRRLRGAATKVVGDLPVLHLAVVGDFLVPARQERGRRLCLARLLFELEAHGVTQVWMEARTRSLDNKDAFAVDALRSRRVISHAIRVDHAYPSSEPLLWIPDIVAGAVTAAEGDESCWINVLAPALTVHRTALH